MDRSQEPYVAGELYVFTPGGEAHEIFVPGDTAQRVFRPGEADEGIEVTNGDQGQ